VLFLQTACIMNTNAPSGWSGTTVYSTTAIRTNMIALFTKRLQETKSRRRQVTDHAVYKMCIKCLTVIPNLSLHSVLSQFSPLQTIFLVFQSLSMTTNKRGADKSLAPATSRCRKTESIVSLERGVCSCAELQVFFLLQRLKGSTSGDAHDLNNMETRAVIKFFFPAGQGAEGISRNSDRNIKGTCTIVCHRQKLGGPV